MRRAAVVLALGSLVALTIPTAALAQATGTGRARATETAGSAITMPTLTLQLAQAALDRAAEERAASAPARQPAIAVKRPTIGFSLQQTTRRADPPPRDPVGGFQVSIFGGVQLRGSASAQAGVALSYFKRSTSNLGLELEGGFTQGPSGEIYHGLLSVVLQSGSRAQKLAPYLTFGAGLFRAQERLRDAVAAALPDFGIEPVEQTETGALLAFGLGFRYYLSEKVSFRADYREFRALTTGDGGFFNRLFGLRRIAGFLAFQL